MTKEKEIVSMNEKVKLESKEILERIKDIKGIFYDDELGILTVTEKMTEKKFREVLYWSSIHGGDYGDFANTLFHLFHGTHHKYLFKEIHRGPGIRGWFTIKGGYAVHVFEQFWLEWEATFDVRGTISEYQFKKENLDVCAILPKLVKKGYVIIDDWTPNIDPKFNRLDDEFKSWFPKYTEAQFKAD